MGAAQFLAARKELVESSRNLPGLILRKGPWSDAAADITDKAPPAAELEEKARAINAEPTDPYWQGMMYGRESSFPLRRGNAARREEEMTSWFLYGFFVGGVVGALATLGLVVAALRWIAENGP